MLCASIDSLCTTITLEDVPKCIMLWYASLCSMSTILSAFFTISFQTFESFNCRRFSYFIPTYVSKNPTFEKSDRNRVRQLSEWNASTLLTPQVTQNVDKGYAVMNGAFQILAIKELQGRVI